MGFFILFGVFNMFCLFRSCGFFLLLGFVGIVVWEGFRKFRLDYEGYSIGRRSRVEIIFRIFVFTRLVFLWFRSLGKYCDFLV